MSQHFTTTHKDNSSYVATSITPTIWKIEYNPYPSESKQHKSFAVLVLPESSHEIVSSTENQCTTLETTEADSLQLQIEADSFSFSHKGTKVLKKWSFHNNVKREYQEPALDQTVTKEKIATEIHFEVHNDSHIYGLGEKTGLALDKKGRMWSMWNTDAWAYHSQTDALYQSIPFAIISTPTDQGILFHGIFVDNAARQQWDLTATDKVKIALFAEPIRMYVMFGKTPEHVLQQYLTLTGLPITLPPLYALGYQQCRWSYYPESVVRDLATQFRTRDIPCDVIYLDIHYMNKYQCFTWDKERFPTHREMINDLHNDHFKLVSILDPGIMVDDTYSVYTDGLEKDVYCKYSKDGEMVNYQDKVWPGQVVFPDYFRKDVREWWGALYKGLVEDGIDGFWNDMNEPACFNVSKTMDEQVLHEGGIPHEHLHNVYGLMMAIGSYEGLRKLQPQKRPFLLTRAAYAGVQRYASSWNGDNTSNWEHLQMSIPMLLNMSLVGQVLVGADVGGFKDDCNEELYARWITMSALTYPICRTHTVENSKQQEPWSFGEKVESISRQVIKLRYRLMPYLYTQVILASKNGSTLIRPLFYEFPQCAKVYDEKYLSTQVMVGPQLMVCPALEQGQKTRSVYLPPGVWYDFSTKQKLQGDTVIEVDVQDWSACPMYVRDGSVIPMRETSTVSTLEGLKVPIVYEAFGDETSSWSGILYLDDGETMAYEKGEYSLYNIASATGDKELIDGKHF